MTNTDTNADGKKLVIVGCGAAKRSDGTWPVKNLYTSNYFAKKWEYAEVFGDEQRVLSAEHGLIAPDEEIEPYDTTIGDLSEGELDEWAHEVGMSLIEWVQSIRNEGGEVDEILVLAGRKYIDPLREREAFHAGVDPTVSFPLQERDLGGIGAQMGWLNDRVEKATAEQVTLEMKEASQ